MTKPEAVYKDPATKTTYIYHVDGNQIFPGVKWNDSPRANTEQLIKKIIEENQTDDLNLKPFSKALSVLVAKDDNK